MNLSPPEIAEHSASSALLAREKRALGAVLGVFVMRMLGLFMLLPVLALYSASLPGSTPMLVGLAVGGYGISQALLQIPFGWASDRYGRRRVLLFGLAIFAAGSLVAAFSDSIAGVIFGRVLQGAGAISAVLSAVVGDTVAEQRRTRAMAFIGVGIGLSFLVSLGLGPLIGSWVGVKGLFLLAFGLAMLAIGLTAWRIPGDLPIATSDATSMKTVLLSRTLWPLNFGIFALHLILAALFVALPFVLRDMYGLEQEVQWKALGLIILLSLPGTVLLVLRSERNVEEARAARLAVPVIALMALSLTVLALGVGHSVVSLTIIVVLCAVFFSGFNFMEAGLPARVSVVAHADQRGTALGLYASFQFLGVFAGGALAGVAMEFGGAKAAFFVCAVTSVVWLVAQLAALPAKASQSPDDAA